MKEKITSETDSGQISAEESRRKFLKTAGKLAIYTPPAMLVLMQPGQATFNKSAGGKQPEHIQQKQRTISLIGKILKALFGRG